MNTLEYIIIGLALVPWTVWFVHLTRGVFRKEEDLFKPLKEIS